ncbi:hypothetical protein WHR41_06901 [Cladosporium halotolerans]|uniref:Nephrocystin 3-like N-terminal domain-containing protein n=1 Tax=Cladosporium halotolerans TaxID=1052096 RepID=A0AB34KI19_9PEZI
MEPVSALSVAAATVQFLEFGLKTLKLCKQIRDSDSDTIELHAEVQLSIKRLELLQQGVTLNRFPRNTVRGVRETSSDCSALAKELRDLLDEIRAIAKSGKRFGALKAALRSLKDQRKIEKLQGRLEQCQTKFQTAVAVDTREQVLQFLENQGNMSDALKNIIMPELQRMQQESSDAHRKTQSQVEALQKQSAAAQDSFSKQLLESGTKSAAAHDFTHRQLSENKAKSAAAHNLTHRQLSANRKVSAAAHKSTHKQLSELQASSASALDSQNKTRVEMNSGFDHAKSSQQTASTYEAFLEGLKFPVDIQEQVTDNLRCKFLHWLRENEPTFWIVGKAGSGKSCLMSFIEGEQRTRAALRSWAGGRPLHIYSFFFWRPGSELQKSICGLLRSMLYQIASAKPAVIDAIISDCPQFENFRWTELKLVSALQRALKQYRQECVFFLIDGLDEFTGDYSELLNMILELQAGSNIKLCLSSRPEVDIHDRLWSKPSIRLQDLNYDDIRTHIQQKLGPRGQVFRGLITEVADRAEGIFLWAVLVTESLISGHKSRDNYSVLLRRLERIPAGLRELFQHMFANIDAEHRESLSIYFTLLKWEQQLDDDSSWRVVSLTKLKLATVLLYGTQFESLQQYLDACSAMRKGIPEQTKGLIELTGCEGRKGLSFLWALKDVRTGRACVQSQEAEPYELLTLELAWVHRSVYDCVLGDSSDGPADWINTIDHLDLARKVLHATRWLTERIPMEVKVDKNQLWSKDLGNDIWCLLSLTRLEDWHDSVLLREVYCTPDGIYDSFCSSVYGSENCQVFSAGFRHSLTQYGETQSGPWSQSDPLTWFWSNVRPEYGQGYLVSRFAQIKRNAHARKICFHLALQMLGPSDEWSEEELPGNSLVLRYLVEEGNSGFESNELSLDQHSRISWHYSCTGFRYELYFLFVQSKRDNDIEFWSAKTRVCDALQVFCGTMLQKSSKEGRASLQIEVPIIFFKVRDLASNEEGSRWQGAILRLLCLDVRAERLRKSSSVEYTKVAAHFDLSNKLTSELMTFLCHQSEDRDMILRFTGMPDDRARCLERVRSEIWANKDGQLDAWRQLYILACVKAWFEDFWISKEHAIELGRTKSELPVY